MIFLSAIRTSCVKTFFGALFGALVCWTASVSADSATAPAAGSLEPIVVTAKRRIVILPDEVLKEQVETVLHDDPYFYDEHVTVTIRNGVATLQGIVFDDWDLRDAIRLARKVPGVKRVVNDLEIKLGGE
jgi:BON domain